MANKLPVAVIGASGIGRIHIREFLAVGANVIGILGSNRKSTLIRAKKLSNEFDLKLRAFSSLEELINANPKAVSICTPPETHLKILERTLDSGLYVFCEKPLFWEASPSGDFVKKSLDSLMAKTKDRLLVNTSNAWFLESYKALIGNYEKPKEFIFRFSTHGSYREKDIGLDLLPHGLSFLVELGCRGNIEALQVEVRHNEFNCQFNLDGVRCYFDFREDEKYPKGLSFIIDGIEVKRIQSFEGGQYSVHLQCDLFENGIEKVADPFRIYIERFINTVSQGGCFSHLRGDIIQNVEWMAYILESKVGILND